MAEHTCEAGGLASSLAPSSQDVGGDRATLIQHHLGMTWSTFYKQARERMASHYGIRGISVDTYKAEYAEGMTPFDLVMACQRMWDQLQAKQAK